MKKYTNKILVITGAALLSFLVISGILICNYWEKQGKIIRASKSGHIFTESHQHENTEMIADTIK